MDPINETTKSNQPAPIESGSATIVAPQKSAPAGPEFVPTKGMLRWFEAAAELGYHETITGVAKEAKLDRDNWYQWLEKPGFVEWWDRQWAKHLRTNRWKLDAIGMKKAESDYSWWQSMMQRTGLAEAEKPTTGPSTAIQINLGDEQIKRLIED